MFAYDNRTFTLFITAGRRFTRWSQRETALINTYFSDWTTGVKLTGPGEKLYDILYEVIRQIILHMHHAILHRCSTLIIQISMEKAAESYQTHLQHVNQLC
jgi:hypothetical protein